GNACTTDVMTGSAATCNVACTHVALTSCCGNGIVEPGETCDPPSSCPTTCNDGNACTTDTLVGSAASCTAACTHVPLTSCCGHGFLEPGEPCDPPSSCPPTCNDGNACTTDTLVGSATSCTAACTHSAVTACRDGDGCCPTGCTLANDTDCTPQCGDGI